MQSIGGVVGTLSTKPINIESRGYIVVRSRKDGGGGRKQPRAVVSL